MPTQKSQRLGEERVRDVKFFLGERFWIRVKRVKAYWRIARRALSGEPYFDARYPKNHCPNNQDSGKETMGLGKATVSLLTEQELQRMLDGFQDA